MQENGVRTKKKAKHRKRECAKITQVGGGNLRIELVGRIGSGAINRVKGENEGF